MCFCQSVPGPPTSRPMLHSFATSRTVGATSGDCSKLDFAPWRGARQIAGGERSEPPELDNGEKSPGRGETTGVNTTSAPVLPNRDA